MTKDSEELESKVSFRVIKETGELAEKKNFKQRKEEMLYALDDIDSFTSICKLAKSEALLSRNKNSTERSPDNFETLGSYKKELTQKFSVKNNFYNSGYLQ